VTDGAGIVRGSLHAGAAAEVEVAWGPEAGVPSASCTIPIVTASAAAVDNNEIETADWTIEQSSRAVGA